MICTRYSLWNFRNLEPVEIQLSSGMNLFTGRNAQGKTNLLEAVYLCSTGRSHRPVRDQEMIRRGESSARVDLTTLHRDGTHLLRLELAKGSKKKVIINNHPAARLHQLMTHCNTVIFSPEDMELIKDGPQFRRRFLDISLSQISSSYFRRLQQYQAILYQRNALLKRCLRAGRWDEVQLSLWEDTLADAGAEIVAARRHMMDGLSPRVAEVHARLSGGKEVLSLEYTTACKGTAAGEIAASIRELYTTHRERERREGTTLTGPHRDDIKITLDSLDIRAYGSQGQQRTAVLAMKFALLGMMETATGERPILLLDDVTSELDAFRSKALGEYLTNSQTIITCTDASRLPFFEARIFTVENGTVSRTGD
ncbi:MAG: DNA replication/repair protein RecF [Christensenellales bacterium]|jgi:DNA replication and repair protein RecF